MIFKNVGAYSKILCLHEAVPELIFLRVKRNSEQVIQSVLHAYHELGYFNPIPTSLQYSAADNPIEFSVRQILEIERIIDIQKKKIDPSVWLEWSYEDFCVDTWAMISNLAQNYLQMEQSCLRKDSLTKLKVSRRAKVSKNEGHRISCLLQQYLNEGNGRSSDEA